MLFRLFHFHRPAEKSVLEPGVRLNVEYQQVHRQHVFFWHRPVVILFHIQCNLAALITSIQCNVAALMPLDVAEPIGSKQVGTNQFQQFYCVVCGNDRIEAIAFYSAYSMDGSSVGRRGNEQPPRAAVFEKCNCVCAIYVIWSFF